MFYVVRVFDNTVADVDSWINSPAATQAQSVFNDYTGNKGTFEPKVSSDLSQTAFVITFNTQQDANTFLHYWRQFRSKLQEHNLSFLDGYLYVSDELYTAWLNQF